MKPEEAINFLDDICSKVPLGREGHIKIQMAMDSIRKLLEKDKPEKPAKSVKDIKNVA